MKCPNIKRMRPENRGFPTMDELSVIAGVSSVTIQKRVSELERILKEREV